MRKPTVISCAVGGLILFGGLAFFAIPMLGGGVFLSPDETANMTAATSMRQAGSFALPDALLSQFPWLHPRSYVATQEAMVPVGFLGMSAILSAIQRLFGSESALVFAPFLALSVLIPLWSWTKSWGRLSQCAAIVTWLSFPTVILYANRSLFPNLPVLCFAIWSTWLVWRSQKPSSLILAGLLAGIAIFIRPLEAMWIIPALIVSFVGRRKEEGGGGGLITNGSLFGVPLLLVLGLGAWLGWKTYGSWLTSGYQLHDPVEIVAAIEAATTTQALPPRTLFATWPFGFHPRNVWFNVRSYLLVYLWPYVFISALAIVTAWKKKSARYVVGLAVWTIGSLSLLYGQALFQDHVRVLAVSLANSFLRYLLPFAAIAALSAGWCTHLLVERFLRVGRSIAVIALILLSAFGYWTAFFRDDEGVWQSRLELVKYQEVRRSARQILDPSTIVVSDRSDKIFFPVFRAVSPLPSRNRLFELVTRSGLPVAAYLRTQTPEQLDEWARVGLRLKPLLTAGNERLYLMQAL